jgi:hypothetical protein
MARPSGSPAWPAAITASLVEPISATTRRRRPMIRPVSRDRIASTAMSEGLLIIEAVSDQLSAVSYQQNTTTLNPEAEC